MSRHNLLVVDGFSLAFRAFYSYPLSLTLPDGQPINAVYGFTTLLFLAIDAFQPTHVCICFDRKEPTYRHQMFPAYKAHRPEPPPEFSGQVPHLRTVLDKLGFKSVDLAGYEADDLMGTLARRADVAKMDAVLLTGDLDSLQLVSEHVKVATGKGGDMTIYTPEKVKERYALSPAQMIDFKAMKGDPSDNIPGVKGVGEKTAATLLQAYQTLDAIYENLSQITPKGTADKLAAGKEMAFISRKLVTIDCDAPLSESFEAFEFTPDWGKICGVFGEYQFRSLLAKYKSKQGMVFASPSVTSIQGEIPGTATTVQMPDGSYQVLSESMLKTMLPLLDGGFAIDIETTSEKPVEAEIVGISIAMSDKKAYYIPVDLPLADPAPVGAKRFLPTGPLALIKSLLENADVPKYTHHGKFEEQVFLNYGIAIRGITFDSMLAAFLLEPLRGIGLKELALNHFGVTMTEFTDLVGKASGRTTFREVPVELAKNYAGADADYTLRLTKKFRPEIDEKFKKIFYEIELPVQAVLAKMEYEGVCIDEAYLARLSQEFIAAMGILEKQIYAAAGSEFNINSPKQLGEILFGKLGLPVIKKTKTGASTDAYVLEKLASQHEIAELIVKYRTYAKLENTYVSALPKLISPVTGKIHTSFNQTIAATGRLSSTGPNLQNIPIRTEEGRKLRQAFIPSHKEGNILSADYSQIELRVLAHLANDGAMIQAFSKGEDIHRSTAALIFHVPYDAVTKDQRNRAKTVNFGITYGQSAFALAEQLGISRTEAKAIIDAYYTQFASIRGFIDSTIAEAGKQGFVTTAFGRVRPIPDIHSQNKQQRAFAERIAVNTRVQGTAADIIKLAMIQIQTAMEAQQLKSKMIIQVHDELVFDVVPGDEETLKNLVKREMESAVSFKVPLVVDIAIGKNWLEA